MQEEREPLLGVVVGRKAVGKTFLTKRILEQYVKGNPAKGIKGRKVLIIDANDEYSEYSAIYLEDVVKFTASTLIQIKRIRPYLIKDGKTVKMRLEDLSNVLNIVLDIFNNGLLMIEDINKYVSDSLKTDVMGAVATNRHRDQDIIMHFQGIGRIGPKIWQNLSWLRFHKITESVRKHKSKFEDKYELLQIVENMVDHEYFDLNNERFCQYVDCENMRLMGNIDTKKFESACETYLLDNPQQTINRQLKKRDGTGKLLYTYPTALKVEIDRLKNMYLPSKKG